MKDKRKDVGAARVLLLKSQRTRNVMSKLIVVADRDQTYLIERIDARIVFGGQSHARAEARRAHHLGGAAARRTDALRV